MPGTLIIGLELPFRIISTSQTLGLLAVLLTGSLALAQLTDALGRRKEGARPADKLPLIIDAMRS